MSHTHATSSLNLKFLPLHVPNLQARWDEQSECWMLHKTRAFQACLVRYVLSLWACCMWHRRLCMYALCAHWVGLNKDVIRTVGLYSLADTRRRHAQRVSLSRSSELVCATAVDRSFSDQAELQLPHVARTRTPTCRQQTTTSSFKAAFTPGQHVARTSNLYPDTYMLRDTCGSAKSNCSYLNNLYPFVSSNRGHWQQTGNSFVADTKNMLPGNMLPWCKRGFTALILWHTDEPLPHSSDKSLCHSVGLVTNTILLISNRCAFLV